jgi:hypothetical protein
MDELEIALRQDEVDPKLLEDLGWNVDTAWQFVRDYERQVRGGQRQSDYTAMPSTQQPMAANSKPRPDARYATSRPAGGTRALGTIHTPKADETTRLREIGQQRVPRRLDSILRGYYSSSASRPGP